MTLEPWDPEFDCSCPRACLCQIMHPRDIQQRCEVYAGYCFQRLDDVIKLQADFKNGIELMLDGKTLKEAVGLDFFEYRALAVISAKRVILDYEECPQAREIIKGTIYETVYFEMKEKYSEAIDKLMKISDEDIQLLRDDSHHKIDL
ncbi:uncharacterized protein LOC130674726 [Microplitis mediator]|uniref:uncharacterized protein LOC130674726 n=1 Tax=Microplitis mediator TaxID=375433 RepID=UPI0025573D4D|nr:uncharacterized protein LOC130674726 [Microplitis mediator]XP_057336122.1 uncharacterized protein LOC130674726 [Microplitis mediator]XP_057336123.1 uncharacterized protein LOC130674726 [Microplitis mediator]XP_057336124.1 uncharacterized protein LOC130674726 [Microplitis mediator]